MLRTLFICIGKWAMEVSLCQYYWIFGSFYMPAITLWSTKKYSQQSYESEELEITWYAKAFFYPMTRSFTFSVPKIIFLIVLQFGVLEGFTRLHLIVDFGWVRGETFFHKLWKKREESRKYIECFQESQF